MKKTIQQMVNALNKSLDHHEYCGWGDSWERECAKHHKLPEQIKDAIAQGEQAMEEL